MNRNGIDRDPGPHVHTGARTRSRTRARCRPACRVPACDPPSAAARPRVRRPGFTLVELMLGLLVTGMIAGVAAGFALATAASWQAGRDEQRLQLTAQNALARIEPILQGAAWITLAVNGSAVTTADASASDDSVPPTAGTDAATPPGPEATTRAALFFWAGDGLIGAPDDRAQLGEMALIEFDPATGALVLYTAKPEQSLQGTDASAARTQLTPAQAASLTTADIFKQQAWVTARPILGSPRPDASAPGGTGPGETGSGEVAPAGVTRVRRVEFIPRFAATQLPGIDIELTLERGRAKQVSRMCVTLRAATELKE